VQPDKEKDVKKNYAFLLPLFFSLNKKKIKEKKNSKENLVSCASLVILNMFLSFLENISDIPL
jgi:hypothetical protein